MYSQICATMAFLKITPAFLLLNLPDAAKITKCLILLLLIALCSIWQHGFFFNNIWQQLRYFFYFNYCLLSRSRHQRACALFTPESRHFPKWQYTYIKNFKKFICWYCCCTHTTWNILYWERSYTIEYNVNKRYQLNWKNFAASKYAL